MGYTHYMHHFEDVSEEDFNAFREDLDAIVEQADIPLERFLSEDDVVCLDAVEGCETFHIFRTTGQYRDNPWGPDRDYKFSFCKTRRLPYDQIVCAGYIALKHHAGDAVELRSDGCFESDWATGVALYLEATGRSEDGLPSFT